MKIITKRLLCSAALLAALFNWSCSSPPTPQQRAEAERRASAPIETPADQLSGTISLTKNFYFVLDASGSMDESPGGGCAPDNRFNTKLDAAKFAIAEFLKVVPDDSNLGLTVFYGGDIRELVKLGSKNRGVFKTAVEQIRAGGGTPLGRAMMQGIDALVYQRDKVQLGYGEFRLVVVTDGAADRGDPMDEAVQYATARGVQLYSVAFCLSDEHSLKKGSLSYRNATSATELTQALRQTLTEAESFDSKAFKQ